MEVKIHLLTLPPEIRNQIYILVLHSPTPISTHFTTRPRRHSISSISTSAPPSTSSTLFSDPSPPLAPLKALLDTNRQLRLETSPLYYSLNTFTFTSAHSFIKFTEVRPARYISLICTLCITLRRHELQSLLFWTLLSSRRFQSLSHLELCFRPSFTEAWLLDKLLKIESLRSVRLGAVGDDGGEAGGESRERGQGSGDGGRSWDAIRYEMEARALGKWERGIMRALEERIEKGAGGREEVVLRSP
ncbi:MAG: hypothetical protein M1836_004744 [Candelina mexicana]|nr:MAG: hypothetical protein M1836_004744 [Candelina mexicana]